MSVVAPPPSGDVRRVPLPITVLEWIPIGCAVLMEAAWITVVAGLVQEYALRHPVVHLGWMLAFVASGVVAARVLSHRIPARWPAVGLLLVIAGGIAGVLLAPGSRAALAIGDPATAFATNPGGLFAGLAVLRGFPHGATHLAFGTIARAVFPGIPGLAIGAAAGGMIADPWRAEFLTDAAIATGLFMGAGILALTFAGFAEVQPSGAPAWRGNPTWIGLLLLAIAGLLAVVIPVSALGGPVIATAIQVVVGIALVPLAIVALLSGAGVGLRRTLLYVGGAALVVWLLSLAPAGSPADRTATSAGAGGPASDSAIQRIGVIGIGGIALVLVIVGTLLIVRAWMRRAPALDTGDPADTRSFDIPDGETWRPRSRQRRRGRFGTPRTAPEAYVALVAELADRPDVRRDVAETPAEHARRLREVRAAGVAGLQLDLLAADFALGVYGAVPLTAPETSRAIARWRNLRRLLGRDGPAVDRPSSGKRAPSARSLNREAPLGVSCPRIANAMNGTRRAGIDPQRAGPRLEARRSTGDGTTRERSVNRSGSAR